MLSGYNNYPGVRPEIRRKVLACRSKGPPVKISSDEAFLILRKWQVELTAVVVVGSLMPSYPLRGLVAVVTREGVWNRGDAPASIWGFSLTSKRTNFLASAFEGFEYLQPAELPSEIRMSLPEIARRRAVLALAKIMKLVRLPRAEGDPLASVQETLYLVEDDPLHGSQSPDSEN